MSVHAKAKSGVLELAALSGRQRQRWLPLALLVAGVLVYLNSFMAPFLFDDAPLLLALQNLGRGEALAWICSSRRALLYATMWLNYQIDGEEPGGYHLVNIGIHLVAGLALFGVVRRTLLSPLLREQFKASAPWLAFAIALLWMVHPLNTQAVTYIVQRSESMMGMFFVLTLYAAIRHLDEQPGATRAINRKGWLAAAVVFSALGMLCKEVMAVAPLMVMLYDWVFTRHSLAALWRRRGLLYGLLWATLGLLLIFGRGNGGDASAGFGFEALTPWQYALSQPLIILKYLKLSLWPHPLVLDYMHPAQHTRFDRQNVSWLLSFVQVAAPVAVIGALVAAAAWGVCKRRAWSFAAAWFFVILAPTSSIMPIADLMFEHRMYLPLAGVIALIVMAGYRLGHKLAAPLRPLSAVVMLAVPTVAMGGWTIHRNYEYRSELSIWQTVVARRPSNPRGYHHLASAHYKAGQLEHAYDAWLKTLELSPEGFPEAYLNLARIELDRGQIAQGRAHIAHAIVLRPDDPDFHVALGEAFLRDNDLDAAAAAFQKALELQSDRVGIAQTHARAASNLGAVRLKQRRTDEAITHLNLALELDPKLADAHANMGLALARLQRFDDAIVQLRAALVLDDTRPDIHNNLGEVLAIQRDLERAEAHFVRALDLDPLYGAAVSNLIVLSRDYAEAGRFPEAARALEVAIIAIQSRRGDPSEWKPYVRILQAFREGHMPVFE